MIAVTAMVMIAAAAMMMIEEEDDPRSTVSLRGAAGQEPLRELSAW
jgi:hypothetical protein